MFVEVFATPLKRKNYFFLSVVCERFFTKALKILVVLKCHKKTIKILSPNEIHKYWLNLITRHLSVLTHLLYTLDEIHWVFLAKKVTGKCTKNTSHPSGKTPTLLSYPRLSLLKIEILQVTHFFDLGKIIPLPPHNPWNRKKTCFSDNFRGYRNETLV